jgi:hypothetical protein
MVKVRTLETSVPTVAMMANLTVTSARTIIENQNKKEVLNLKMMV